MWGCGDMGEEHLIWDEAGLSERREGVYTGVEGG